MKASIATLVDNAERIGSVTVVAHRLPDGTGAGDLRSLVGDIRGRLGSDPAVVALIAAGEGSVPFVVSVNQAAQDAGLRANDLVGAIGPAVDGRGGGKADTAQGLVSIRRASTRRCRRCAHRSAGPEPSARYRSPHPGSSRPRRPGARPSAGRGRGYRQNRYLLERS